MSLALTFFRLGVPAQHPKPFLSAGSHLHTLSPIHRMWLLRKVSRGCKKSRGSFLRQLGHRMWDCGFPLRSWSSTNILLSKTSTLRLTTLCLSLHQSWPRSLGRQWSKIERQSQLACIVQKRAKDSGILEINLTLVFWLFFFSNHKN